jgi:hypothetical protein
MNYQTPESGATKPHCRYCDVIELRRQGRTGFWQTRILGRLGFYPWECGLCRRIFLLRQRHHLQRHRVRGMAPKRSRGRAAA